MTFALYRRIAQRRAHVPDLAAPARFYTERVAPVDVVARSDGAVYLRGTGDDHHLLSLHPAGAAALRHVTLPARNAEALPRIASAATPGRRQRARGRRPDRRARWRRRAHLATPTAAVPRGARRCAPRRRARSEGPAVRLAHVVLNSHDVAATQRFFEQVLGFALADRTRIMAFMNCNAITTARARRRRQRRAQPHRVPDARPRCGDARRRPHARRRLCRSMGPRPPRPRRQRLQLLRRPVRRGHRIHGRGPADRRQLPGRRPRRLDLAARPRRPVGHLAAARARA